MFYGADPSTMGNFEETTLKKQITRSYFTSKKHASSCIGMLFLLHCLTCHG